MGGTKGLILSGSFGELLARQKSTAEFELGELLIAESPTAKTLMQVYDLLYGSQISGQNLELISGMTLEENSSLEFMDPHVRNYTLAKLKSLITIPNNSPQPKVAKSLPGFFSELKEVTKEDLTFITTPKNPLFLGKLRSGSKVLDFPLAIEGRRAISHHILIPATTGRGKSNLVKCLLWKVATESYAGMLVLDPHDEYYNDEPGLKSHPKAKEQIKYYSPAPLPGNDTLVLNLNDVTPEHFQGAVDWSTAQREALSAYWKQYRKEWIEAVVLEKPLTGKFMEGTLGVIRRRVMDMLNLQWDGEQLHCDGIFKLNAGTTTIKDIVNAITQAKVVIVDTSSFDGREEILIGSMITTELFRSYKQAKLQGTLKERPVAGIVIEEAPRVLGKEVLEKGKNIFSTIAREGRKFKVGLVAITQLPSLIPRQLLANMNTKIILGIEMKPEREAIIQSAAQDLSQDDRAIASLDKGEAIVTSNFAPFALPVKVPLFDDLVAAEKQEQEPIKKSYPGL
jgi:DNA helicase HerA-like ATPase